MNGERDTVDSFAALACALDHIPDAAEAIRDIGGHVERRLAALEQQSEPRSTQGTWAWACEQMLAGERVRRSRLDECEAVGLNGADDVILWYAGATAGKYPLDADDLRATDWEIDK